MPRKPKATPVFDSPQHQAVQALFAAGCFLRCIKASPALHWIEASQALRFARKLIREIK